jgi:hypothetical protein
VNEDIGSGNDGGMMTIFAALIVKELHCGHGEGLFLIATTTISSYSV